MAGRYYWGYWDGAGIQIAFVTEFGKMISIRPGLGLLFPAFTASADRKYLAISQAALPELIARPDQLRQIEPLVRLQTENSDDPDACAVHRAWQPHEYLGAQWLYPRVARTWSSIAEAAGVANDRDGRGVGVGDFNNDGRLDFYQGNARQASQLYLNATENAGHWVELKLEGSKANRNAIGARVYLRAQGESWLREVNGGNGYSSQSTFRLHFGLGTIDRIDEVEIRWPGGSTEILKVRDGKPPLPIDAISTIVEGKAVQR